MPFQILLMLALVAVFTWIVRKTLFSKYLLVTGGNEDAAYLSGIPTVRVKMIALYRLRGARRTRRSDFDFR